MNIERFFNETWRAKRRSLGTRVVYHLGFILVSPFLVLLLLSVCAFFSNDLSHYSIRLFNNIGISAFVQWIMYYLLCSGIFTLINKYVPNTSVRWEAAFRSSLLEGIVFVSLQFLYTNTQLFVSRMSTIYGAVAAFPLFLIWLNWCWTIILAGAEVCKQYQHTLMAPASTDNKKMDIKN